MPADTPQTLSGHLEELRARISISLLALVAAACAGFSQAERLIEGLKAPAGDLLPQFVFFAPTEAFGAYLKVAGLAGLVAAMPVILWQAWLFVRAGLTPQERSWGFGFVVAGSALFALGIAFAYTVLLPASLRILLGIGRGQLVPVISIDAYLTYVITLLGWCGAVFELPAVIFILAKVGIVTPEWLRQQRPTAILTLVIAAALLTPTTDMFNQLLMTVPMVALYEISIPLAKLAAPKGEGN
jgi:sec-independent protein translocase protein TatC